jgi:hypothetical protein
VYHVVKLIQTIAWGLYLASSWTWCIGMFLPVILIDLFGWPGFIVFAVPNIAGVVMFGYVIRTRQRSEAMVESQGEVMRWFSIITITYHVFFLMILGQVLSVDWETPWLSAAVVAGPFVAAIVLGGLSTFALLPLAALLWVASALTFFETGLGPLAEIAWNGPLSTLQLAPLVPVLGLGFLICPVFDLTFHRAIRESPSRHAFAAFAPAFALMLLLTCAIWLWRDFEWRTWAFGHLLWQSAITMGLHLRELRLQRKSFMRFELYVIVAAPLLGVLIGQWAINGGAVEVMYVRFLIFYGLIFPAYAIVFMNARSPAVRSRRNLIWFGLTLVLAAPFYEIGFIHERTWMLLIPMAVAAGWIVFGPRMGRRVAPA